MCLWPKLGFLPRVITNGKITLNVQMLQLYLKTLYSIDSPLKLVFQKDFFQNLIKETTRIYSNIENIFLM